MTPRVLLEAVMILAPDHHAARYDYAQCLVQRHKHIEAREQIRQLLDMQPANPDYRARRGQHRRRPRRSPSGDCDIPRTAGRYAGLAGSEPLDRARAEDGREGPRGDRSLSRGRRGPAQFRGRLLESGQPQDLSVRRGRDRPHARRGGVRGDGVGGPLSPVFRARQGPGGPGRDRGVLAVLRAGQRPEARREPLPSRNP